MPAFRYRAVAPGGQAIEGVLSASDREACVHRLHEMGYLPLQAEPAAAGGGLRFTLGRKERLTRRQLVVLTRELATLLEARLPLDRALDLLIGFGVSPAAKAVLTAVHAQVLGGEALSAALAAHPASFPPFYVAMLAAGEAVGAPDEVLARLADHLERSAALQETVRSALIYPAIVATMVLLTIVVMLTVVLPEFRGMFEDGGARLPAGARLMMAVSDWLRAWGWSLPAAAMVPALLLRADLRRPDGRLRWHRWLLRLPLAGSLAAKAETARLARTLSSLLGNGVPITQALAIARDTLGNAVVRQAIGDVAARLTKGQGLAAPLARIDSLPPLLVHLVAVGEETGQLERMLAKAADIFEREVQVLVGRLVALLTPGLTILLGSVVAAVVGSILSAILSVYSLPM